MKMLSNALPWATIGLFAIAGFYTVVGGVEVIRGQLDFESYGKQVVLLGGAFGLLGIGRGVAAKK